MGQENKTAEDRFNEIIDNIELRAMAVDGPVTPTLQAATEDELSELWELVNEISPKRKALARRVLKDKTTNEDVCEYLRQEGLDPEQVAREGSVFVKTVTENISLRKENADLRQQLAERERQVKEGVEYFDIGQARIKELEQQLEKERREGRQEWERLQVSTIDQLQAKIKELEVGNEKLKDALQNATQVIRSLIAGNRVVNLDEAIAYYDSIL